MYNIEFLKFFLRVILIIYLVWGIFINNKNKYINNIGSGKDKVYSDFFIDMDI